MTELYTPNPEVLIDISHVTLAAVIGPTAVGKTTLMQAAIAESPDMQLVLTTTTRQPRPGEQDGVDYHFRTPDEVTARMHEGGYVQVTTVGGQLYATAPEDYAAEGISVMAVVAEAMSTFQTLPFSVLRPIFVLPPSREVWQEWLAERNFSPEQQQHRMREAAVSLRYGSNADMAILINDATDKQASAHRLAALAHGETLATADVVRGRELAEDLLQLTLQGLLAPDYR